MFIAPRVLSFRKMLRQVRSTHLVELVCFCASRCYKHSVPPGLN